MENVPASSDNHLFLDLCVKTSETGRCTLVVAKLKDPGASHRENGSVRHISKDND